MKQTKNPHKRPHNVTFSNTYKNYLLLACNPQGKKVVMEFDTWNEATTAQINWRKYLRYCEWLAHEENDEKLLQQAKQAAPWYWALKDEHGQTSPPRGEDRRKPCKVTGTFGPKELNNLEDKMLKSLFASNPQVFNTQEIGLPIVTNPDIEHLAKKYREIPESNIDEDVELWFGTDKKEDAPTTNAPTTMFDPHTQDVLSTLGATVYRAGDPTLEEQMAMLRTKMKDAPLEDPNTKPDTSWEDAIGLDADKQKRDWDEGEKRRLERLAQAPKEDDQ